MNHALTDAIAQRTSANFFDPARGVDDDDIHTLISWATRAPTAFNLQNWRFIAVRSQDGKRRLRELAWNQPKVSEAAVTFIVLGVLPQAAWMADRLQPSVDAGFMPAAMVPSWEAAASRLYADSPQTRRDEAVRSATFGASTLMLAGQARGLAASPMTGFDAPGVAEAFGLRQEEVPVMLVAMGYAQDGNWPQKPRRPVNDVLELA
ncbi:nitroreductase family protein [Achromobacter anxifer]|jgi:nitroreductase|uniref:NAD(P)H nitroreductase MhqN n=1 Tax=Achromobacter anxifer TaxID=1287737 RepID=A0A6S7ENJ4_9BURK|nr:nitroreductase family protein [Achromobacter anxifer]MDF8359780.1 nitroreductase family protein [Achromobacter anxifer]CAB3918114.1 Putative NAD(P)H nitroreductase MhqN [Achromobacter anxifer]CAB5511390.1 Putative NAD(P)H nitroreductase MhqN [Achromobacter anxifer]